MQFRNNDLFVLFFIGADTGYFPGFSIHRVTSNGNCLFASIAHQLSLGGECDAASCCVVRHEIVDYIEEHKAAYADVSAAGTL